MSDRYDVVVIGTGPAGEVAVSRLARNGLRVAVVERELVGGECAYWGCIPSKTLLRPPEVRCHAGRVAGLDEPLLHWAKIAAYRDHMIRHLDDAGQIAELERSGVDVLKQTARILAPDRVQAGDLVLSTDRIVVATGSEAAVPAIDGLAESGFWTNREATNVQELPESIVVLGGGAVGVELGQFFGRVGVQVTIIEAAERLLGREDAAIGRLVRETLEGEGVDVLVEARAESVRRHNRARLVRLADGREVRGQELLVAAGRVPRVEELGLEKAGITADRHGIRIDDRCRAGDGVWAIGDVTGVLPFTHVAKYQARVAAADIVGETVQADYPAIPRVVFTDPEIATVGLTERQAREQGFDVLTSTIGLPEAIARPYTYEQNPRGMLGLVADRERQILLGAWAFAPLASEWIHYAALAIKVKVPLRVLADTAAQFPTYSEAFLAGVESLDGRHA